MTTKQVQQNEEEAEKLKMDVATDDKKSAKRPADQEQGDKVSLGKLLDTIMDKLKTPMAMRPADQDQGDKTAFKIDPKSLNSFLVSFDMEEETKLKAATLLESAVNEKINSVLEEKISSFQEQYVANVSKVLEEHLSELIENIDDYISYTAEKFVEENEVVIESSLKAEGFDKLMNGLKDLFEENNIVVDEEKIDVVHDLETKVHSLQTKLNEEMEKNIGLMKVTEQFAIQQIFNEETIGLTALAKEKLKTLSENISYDNVDEYKTKLAILKETFSEKPKTSQNTGIVNEDVIVPVVEEDINKPQDNKMAMYMATASKLSKK